MNSFDIVLLVLACILVVIGMVKGLVRILIGLAALIAAFALAAIYHQPLADRLGGFEISVEATRLISYALIFVVVMLAGGLIAYLVRRLLKAAMLNWADRLGGAALGLVAAAVAAALLVLPVVAYSPHGTRLLGDSMFAPYVTAVADVANELVPDDLSQRYLDGIEDLREFWKKQVFEPGAETLEI